jgi:hypothetical protein
LDEGEVMSLELVVARSDAPERLQLPDQALDEVPSRIGIAVEVGILGLVGAVWDDRKTALAAQRLE